MNKIKERISFKAVKKVNWNFLQDLIKGTVLTKDYFINNIWFLLLIASLVFFYVDNGYRCQRDLTRVIELNEEIKDVKYEYLTISAQMMNLTKQTNIEKMVRERGLDIYPTLDPPVVVSVKEDNK